MRKVTIDEFFEKAQQGLENSRELLEHMEESEVRAEKIDSVEEAIQVSMMQMLPLSVRAARLFECVSDDLTEFFLDTLAIRQDIAGGEVDKFFNTYPEMEEKYWKAFANLARSYALRGKCHPTTRHYLCYCDENPFSSVKKSILEFREQFGDVFKPKPKSSCAEHVFVFNEKRTTNETVVHSCANGCGTIKLRRRTK